MTNSYQIITFLTNMAINQHNNTIVSIFRYSEFQARYTYIYNFKYKYFIHQTLSNNGIKVQLYR